MYKKIVAILIIIGIVLIALLFLLTQNSNLKSGDTINIQGEIGRVDYVNTSYGNLPIIVLKDHINKFREANFLDNKMYEQGWTDALDIYGNFDQEYTLGNEIDITLHFEEMQLNDARFLWAKELGIYLKLPSAISEAIDSTSYIAGFYLKSISSDKDGHSSYEIFTTNQDQYPLNLFNVSLKKISHKTDLQENAVFSTLLNNTLNIIASEYMSVSGTGEGTEKIDFMNSLNDSISQNGFIEFIDKNSNGLIDDHDVFNLSIPPTEDENKLETYLLLIGIDDLGNFNNVAAGVKYIINWYDGIYEEIKEKELIAINYTSHQENGTLIDTILRISRVNSKADLSIDNFQINLQSEDYTYNFFGYLREGVIDEENNASISFIDSNKNGLLDIDDLFLIKGLKNSTSLRLMIRDYQANTIAHYPWITGEGYSRKI